MSDRYEEPEPMDWAEAMEAIASGDESRASKALVSLAYFWKNRAELEDLYVPLLSHSSSTIRGVAATCLGHVARIHGYIRKDLVVPALKRLIGDQEVSGRAEDALEDIDSFT
jgi:hypothetical protein